MFLRAYIRSSRVEKNSERTKELLTLFAEKHNHQVDSFYIENESAITFKRPELMKLISDSDNCDIILVDKIGRLAQLNQSDWKMLNLTLARKQLVIVSPELPTSWIALKISENTDSTNKIIQAINGIILEMLEAVVHKDYENLHKRRIQGINKAQTEGKYLGRKPDFKKRENIALLLKSGHSYSDIQRQLNCSRNLISDVKKQLL